MIDLYIKSLSFCIIDLYTKNLFHKIDLHVKSSFYIINLYVKSSFSVFRRLNL